MIVRSSFYTSSPGHQREVLKGLCTIKWVSASRPGFLSPAGGGRGCEDAPQRRFLLSSQPGEALESVENTQKTHKTLRKRVKRRPSEGPCEDAVLTELPSEGLCEDAHPHKPPSEGLCEDAVLTDPPSEGLCEGLKQRF